MTLKGWLRRRAEERQARRERAWRLRSAAPGGGDWPGRVVYLSPDNHKPTGGIKVFYQHVQALRRLGVDAHVMHLAPGFRCHWFDSDAPVLHFGQLRPGDQVVLPEVMPHFAARLRVRGVPYSIFVQNGYLTLEVSDFETTRQAYEGAQAVLSISADTAGLLQRLLPALRGPVLPVQPAVQATTFSPGAKQRLVTYMPRKMPQHARMLAGWLAATHPDWRFQALEGLSERQVAEALRASRIFLAFGELEGLGLPPLEAALAGNLVLGYDGWGGREYFQPPLFHAVAVGDVRGFMQGFDALLPLASADDLLERHAAPRAALAQRYGGEAETALLREVALRLGWFAAAPLPSTTPPG